MIDVIIPVYDGFEATRECLRSVLEAPCRLPFEVLVVDDRGPSPELSAWLDELAVSGRVTLVRNPRNLGFVRSVNAALCLHPDRDALIVNADATVYGDFADRLARLAHSAPDIGTVTPLSDNATILTYPRPGDDYRSWPELDHAACDRFLAAAWPDAAVDIPTAVGFCMYIRRDCLHEVGGFDPIFGAGYGEENDFCLRAAALGWRHVAAPGVFVRHLGGVSFGPGRSARLGRNLAILRARHPGYDRQVADFLVLDPLLPVRRALDVERLRASGGLDRLFLTTSRPGGTDRHVREKIAALAARGGRGAILAPEADRPDRPGRPGRVVVTVPGRDDLPNLVYDPAAEHGLMLAHLRALGLGAVEIHHFLGLPEAVLGLPDDLGLPFEATIHDYAWHCPRITLLDGQGRYCGEPDEAACRACLAAWGHELGGDGPDIPDVAAHRARSRMILSKARRLTVPSEDAARRVARHFPGLVPLVAPHDDPMPAAPPGPPDRHGGRRPVRVALIGAIGRHKGYDLLLACARDAAARDLPLFFVVVGYTLDDAALFATGRVFVTGPYPQGQAEAVARGQDCDLALIPSVWPETWCYALTEAWRAGLPTLGFDIGAVAARIAASGHGRVLPLGLDPAGINDALLDMAGAG